MKPLVQILTHNPFDSEHYSPSIVVVVVAVHHRIIYQVSLFGSLGPFDFDTGIDLDLDPAVTSPLHFHQYLINCPF
jgi:hypothetical protein